MSYNSTGSAGLSAESREHYNKTMLHFAKPKFMHAKWAKKYEIPAHEGKTINWRRKERLSPATTALTEGVTPPGASLVITEVEVTVEQYGNWMGFTDRVEVQSIDKILTENAEVLGENSGETLDIICRDALNAGTNVMYANAVAGRSSIAGTDKINEADIKKAVRSLDIALAPRFSDGETEFFIGLAGPYVWPDIQALSGFVNPGYYSKPAKIETGHDKMAFGGEAIMLWGVLFIKNTQTKVWPNAGSGGAVNVYSTLIFGKESYGDVDIARLGMETIYKGLGSAGTEDPLDQRQTQAWKTTYASKILNQNFLIRYESAATQ